MNVSGNTVLITGGGSGIGLSLAKALLENENQVIICGRDPQKLEAARATCPGLHAIPCDIRRDSDLDHLVEEVSRKFPALNILVNNAGIQHMYDFLADPDALDKAEEEVAINLVALIRLSKRFLPILQRQKEAALVNVSSGLAFIPKQSAPTYCATKAGVHLFTKALRYQLETTCIRVFEVVPPVVDTDMTRGSRMPKMSPDALAAEVLAAMKKNRFEIHGGRTKMLFFINRWAPSLAEKILRKA